MRGGFAFGRIFGIEISIDSSWLFIFLLVVWQLAVGVFPVWHPAWGPALDWGIAVVAALLFFASVLLHELAHSLVALSRGLPVRRITLFLFGGVSNIQREPSSPGAEFLIAVVGPLTSLALGALFLLLGGVSAHGIQGAVINPTHLLSRLNPLSTLLLWLGPINIMLGVFNLIPGFPLDGGRILRSILWAATGNLRRATGWAVAVAHIVAWLFILGGIAMAFGSNLPVLGGGLLGGLWLVFIGWFLHQAATVSYQQVVLKDVLEGMPVSRLMHVQVHPVAPDVSISALVNDYVMETDDQAYPVIQDDRLLGLVSLDDVHKIPHDTWASTSVSQVMTPVERLEMIAPRDDAANSVMKMAQHHVNEMPVMENGHLAGMLRRQDVVKWLNLHSDAA
jgi:Zn-dependent protease/predicted transcriptional regulator